MRIRVVDLETTGLSPPEHAPCEVAWVDLQSDDKRDLFGQPVNFQIDLPISSKDEPTSTRFLCNPRRPIPPESSAIHHIIDRDVISQSCWQWAIQSCVFYSAKEPINGVFPDDSLPSLFAAHNAKFERQWLTDDLTEGQPWICTYKCALRLWPEAPGHSNQTLRYWLKPKGLDRQIANLAHRAFPDAYVTAFLLQVMLEMAALDQLIEWSKEPALLPRVNFGQHRGLSWTEVETGFLHWILNRDFDEDIMFTARTELNRRSAKVSEEERGL
jgi:exodeoxyribonuclease X